MENGCHDQKYLGKVANYNPFLETQKFPGVGDPD